MSAFRNSGRPSGAALSDARQRPASWLRKVRRGLRAAPLSVKLGAVFCGALLNVSIMLSILPATMLSGIFSAWLLLVWAFEAHGRLHDLASRDWQRRMSRANRLPCCACGEAEHCDAGMHS